MHVEAGTLIGQRYEVIKYLGAGGMGAVYLACDVQYRDFIVALKVLYPGIIKTKENRERFRNEIIASYRVSHPNIVRAYEYFDEDDFQAYAMEYVSGGDLAERMKQGALPIPDVIKVLKQIASGLAAIHEQGIVHRDMKPENILLASNGAIKISDFGVARLRGSMNLTQAGAMVGTPKYVSPEYVETGECDHRGDIYALGVMGYELIAGISPFKAETKVSLMLERFKIDVNELHLLAPQCPPDLIEIIARALKVKITERYQSAQDMVRDLELLEQGKTLTNLATATDETVAEVKPQKRHLLHAKYARFATWQVAGSVMLVLLLVATVGTYYKFSASKLSFSQLPVGVYSGSVMGLLSDNSRHPLTVWRTKVGSFALLGKEHCNVQEISNKGQFACGDLQFEIEIKSIEKKQAVGSITELSWDTYGSWTLEQASSEVPL